MRECNEKKRDHYVAQAYLRQFASENGDLFPYYKKGHVVIGKSKKTKSICFEASGDTNQYFQNPRILDQYLATFENLWPNNVDKLEKHYLDGNTKYEIAGYIAFLRACNPTAKRLGQKALSGALEPLAYNIMSSKLEEYEGLSSETKTLISNAINEKKITLDIDREYAHAYGIKSLIDTLHRFYCSPWLVLKNNTNIPFITSDNPATLYYKDNNPQFANIYVPIKPSLAILISPDISIQRPNHDDVVKYTNEQDRFATIKQSYVKLFNKLVVKSAEKLVLHKTSEGWIEQLVLKYKNWRMETVVDHLPTDNGIIIISRQRQIEKKSITNK